jgi:hypothetical protein
VRNPNKHGEMMVILNVHKIKKRNVSFTRIVVVHKTKVCVNGKTQTFVATLASKKLPIGEAVPKKTTLCTPPPPRLDKRQAFPLILVAMKTAWDRLIRLP